MNRTEIKRLPIIFRIKIESASIWIRRRAFRTFVFYFLHYYVWFMISWMWIFWIWWAITCAETVIRLLYFDFVCNRTLNIHWTQPAPAEFCAKTLNSQFLFLSLSLSLFLLLSFSISRAPIHISFLLLVHSLSFLSSNKTCCDYFVRNLNCDALHFGSHHRQSEREKKKIDF